MTNSSSPSITWNQTKHFFPEEFCIHELIEESAQKDPQKEILRFEGKSLTYEQLLGASFELADRLVEKGVGPDVPVVVVLERSLEMVVALLAVLQAGGAYLPLDPHYPEDRISIILEEAQAPVILTLASTAHRLPPSAANILSLDDCLHHIPLWDRNRRSVPPSPENLAYIIYTSGSTGRPKGVMNTHKGLCNRLWWMQEKYSLSGSDRVLQKTPYTFDVSVWEFFWPLMVGAELVIAKPEGHRDPNYLIETIYREEITTIHFVPSMLRAFVESAGVERCKSLRQVFTSGEALPYALQKRFFEKISAKLHNLYGPTEAAIDVTFWDCKPTDPGPSVPIGAPIYNTQIYILNEELVPVPVGETGELYIAGVGLARGYLRRPDLTSERFLSNPFSPGERMYRTGDLARWRADGNIEYIGRIDSQIKLRGFRIELGEIDQVLQQFPSVQFAATRKVGERLVAWVSPKQSSLEPLTKFLRSKLPSYMVPTLVSMEELPLSPNGKLDYRKLEESFAITSGRGLPPTSPQEILLAEIWSQQLNVQNIGTDDNYFELGGDSIRALSMLGELRTRGYEFSLPSLYERGTLGGLALALRSANAPPTYHPFALLHKADRAKLPDDAVDAYPMTRLQRGMLYESERQPGCGIYHDVYSLKVELDLSVELLEQALVGVTERHPILRTTMHLVGYSLPMVVVHQQARIQVTEEEISYLPENEQKIAILAYMDLRRRQDWDYARPGLFSIHLQRCSHEHTQLHLSFHHAILDGWSLSALLTELLQECKDILDGARISRKAPLCHFADYVALEQQAEQDEQQQLFWRRKAESALFQTVPMLSSGSIATALPRDSEPTALPHLCTLQGGELRAQEIPADPIHVSDVFIAPATCQRLRELSRRWNIPFQQILLTVHLRVLATATGRATITTGVVTNGRPEQQGGDEILGLFLNVLPLTVHLTKDMSWEALARLVFEAYREILPQRRYPLSKILEEHASPLFDVVFNFVDFHVYNRLNNQISIDWNSSIYFEANEFSLVPYFMVDHRGNLLLRLYANSNSLDASSLLRCGQYYENALKSLAEHPDATITSVALLPQETSQHLSEILPYGRGFLPLEEHVHELFLRRVAEGPKITAVEQADRKLTYAQLDEEVEKFARILSAQGVGPGVVIGLALERSIDMVVAVLSIIRLGACYCPIDPNYPQERIDFLLKDAAPEIIISREEHISSKKFGNFRCISLENLKEQTSNSGNKQKTPIYGNAPIYIIYTSGSTGQPKGVIITYDNIRALLHAYLAVFPLRPGDRLLQSFAYGFDGFQLEILPALSAGATLVFSHTPQHSAPGITAMTLTPSLLRTLQPANFPELRLLGVGGEPLNNAIIHPWFKENRSILNLYGPTECTIVTAVKKIAHSEEEITLGQGLANYRTYVLTELEELADIGVPGELCVAGPGVARGYLNRPEISKDRFVFCPFFQHSKMYRTGDIVYWNRGGELVFCGRRDGQIKLRGFRIELGEIESVIAAHPSVRATAVIVNGPLLVTFVVLKTSSPLATNNTTPDVLTRSDAVSHNLAELRNYVRSALPAYMQPHSFVVLDTMPTDSNGKVDKRSLSARLEDIQVQTRRSTPNPPRNSIELELLAIFESLLPTRPIGIQDGFFELGGDSLTAMQLLASIEQLRGRKLSLASLLDSPTIETLAQKLSTEHPTSTITLQAKGQNQPFFCIHPAIRTVFCYRDLARLLGEDQPFIGLEWIQDREPSSIQELARIYVKEIKKIQPKGPYRIGGWSAGGNVACEIAVQFEDAGDTVSLLALFDTRPSQNQAQRSLTELLHTNPIAPLAILIPLLERMTGTSLDLNIESFTEQTPDFILDQLVRTLIERRLLPQEVASLYVRRFYQDLRVMSRLVTHYAPTRHPTKITLFTALEADPPIFGHPNLNDASTDITLGWASLGVELDIHPTPGSHQTMLFAPNVSFLARDLAQCLVPPPRSVPPSARSSSIIPEMTPLSRRYPR